MSTLLAILLVPAAPSASGWRIIIIGCGHTSPGIDRALRGAEQLGAIAYAGDLAAGRFSPKSCRLAAREADFLGK
ncbi:MAG: hypothetical protein E5V72_27285 [Mesorhizobium sp.]|nr:MAG: hypothetical protein E5V72_27285 [Mesorhizobium sp.]